MSAMETTANGARRVRWMLAILTASVCAACGSSSAQGDLKVVCDAKAELKIAGESTFDYSGGDSGALKVAGFFGDMQLTATRTIQTSTVSGETLEIVGISARGPANVRMPEKASMESCLVKNSKPNDPDLVYHTNLCQRQAPLSKTPLAIDAEVTITIIDAPLADVYITRAFKEASATIGKPIKVETLPPLQCKVKTGMATR
jgi:hypothetical protein